MDSSSRLKEIQSFIEMAPSDPFPRYGLAMEYKNLGDHTAARRCFAELLQLHPDYVPQYLMHGQLLVELGDHVEARRVLGLGVERARQARNFHAHGELQALLDRLDAPDGVKDR
jgi:tetratricopeptide (TPR) repeat protein